MPFRRSVGPSNQEIEGKLDFDHIINMVQEVQGVCHDLTVKELKLRSEKKHAEANDIKQLILEFQDLSIKKIRDISYHICSSADAFQPEVEMKDGKEETKKYTQGKSDMVASARQDLRLGFLVSYFKNHGVKSQIDFHEAMIRATPPVSLKTTDYIMRVFWTSFDYLTFGKDEDEDSEDEDQETLMRKKYLNETHSRDYYSKDMVLGGVLNAKVFEMPPVPTTFKGWKIKHLKEKKDALAESHIVKSDNSSQIQKGNLTSLQYKLPANLYIGNPKKQIAIWLKEKKEWSLDSEFIDKDNIQFTLEGYVYVHTYRLAPICFMQTRCLDFPYKSWKLRSIRENDLACLDIEGQRLFIQFHIGVGFIQLKKIVEKENVGGQLKEFVHLMNKDMEPADLLYEMYRCGVNLLPVDQDSDHCALALKQMDAEERAIEEVSMAVRAYFFRSFRWMAHTPKGRGLSSRHDHRGIHPKYRI